uniref:ZAD domain-containing protein n=1 Tax=Anopheles minimus TaxID=112268 RepID=A0A182WFI2_9DIPT
MSLLAGFSAFEIIASACKICEESYETMGSIICPPTDTKLLEKIYKSTNVRVQPRKGIITPVCEYCRNRIDEYDEEFKPYMKEYYIESVGSENASEDASIDPLAIGFENETHCTDDTQENKHACIPSLDDKEAFPEVDSDCHSVLPQQKCPATKKEIS